jgi:hypothetical protein
MGRNAIRLVTHINVNRAKIEEAAAVLKSI